MKRFVQSFRDAAHGLRYVWRHEQNFRLQIVIGLVVIGLGVYLQVSRTEFVVLVALILLVLLLEILNSVLEKFIDLLKPRLHTHVAIVKDMLAALVLCAALGSAVIGILIFYPYVMHMFVVQ